ncbi:hypothetical protein DPMN_179061 [Dreissena polymorpha]|uniref:Uncharacterized protein n=1 Tax=Dreissena polymorpha TaxID=45954 RepID=A0A9D4EE25_DREPO|nr:hypothetical protein DPMN_179061 [Dreissena polymorpha]
MPGHQNVHQRHLLGIVTLLHEGVYREQLVNGSFYQLERPVDDLSPGFPSAGWTSHQPPARRQPGNHRRLIRR